MSIARRCSRRIPYPLRRCAPSSPARPRRRCENSSANRTSKTSSTGRRRRGQQGGHDFAIYRYTDGESDFTFFLVDGEVANINEQDRCNLTKDSAIFATVFQFFYLRLAVFFGCVGIFTNLFRGEMLDKSLHFYLLAPMRREVLLAGKYLAGLSAAVVIFTLGTALQIAALSWHFEPGQVAAYLHGTGWHDIAAYLGVTALACAGYGSIFLAAGLLFRNPILPATVVMLWESINIFLPAALKKISVIFYLQALCPTVAAPESDTPALLRLLISSAEFPPAWLAIAGLTVVMLVVLGRRRARARRLEITTEPEVNFPAPACGPLAALGLPPRPLRGALLAGPAFHLFLRIDI